MELIKKEGDVCSLLKGKYASPFCIVFLKLKLGLPNKKSLTYIPTRCRILMQLHGVVV